MKGPIMEQDARTWRRTSDDSVRTDFDLVTMLKPMVQKMGGAPFGDAHIKQDFTPGPNMAAGQRGMPPPDGQGFVYSGVESDLVTADNKDEHDEHGDGSPHSDSDGDHNDESGADKKKRFEWTPELHSKFVQVVNDLGANAVPSRILEQMGSCGVDLTRHQVSSHLQKYRMRLSSRNPKISSMLPRADKASRLAAARERATRRAKAKQQANLAMQEAACGMAIGGNGVVGGGAGYASYMPPGDMGTWRGQPPAAGAGARGGGVSMGPSSAALLRTKQEQQAAGGYQFQGYQQQSQPMEYYSSQPPKMGGGAGVGGGVVDAPYWAAGGGGGGGDGDGSDVYRASSGVSELVGILTGDNDPYATSPSNGGGAAAATAAGAAPPRGSGAAPVGGGGGRGTSEAMAGITGYPTAPLYTYPMQDSKPTLSMTSASSQLSGVGQYGAGGYGGAAAELRAAPLGVDDFMSLVGGDGWGGAGPELAQQQGRSAQRAARRATVANYGGPSWMTSVGDHAAAGGVGAAGMLGPSRGGASGIGPISEQGPAEGSVLGVNQLDLSTPAGMDGGMAGMTQAQRQLISDRRAQRRASCPEYML